MKKTVIIIFTIILLVISFTSCHKVDVIDEPQTAYEYLTKHVWKGKEVNTFKDGRYLDTQKIAQARLDFNESKQFLKMTTRIYLHRVRGV